MSGTDPSGHSHATRLAGETGRQAQAQARATSADAAATRRAGRPKRIVSGERP